MWNYKDLSKSKFNKLIVIKPTNKRTSNGGIIWLCRCDCGNIIELSTSQLKRNKSCGCELKKWRKHFGDNSKKNRININDNLYKRLKHIKERCYNTNNKEYKNYGARGIIVCDEWLDKEKGFLNFYNWAMDNGYRDDLTIDRIDVNGNYEPSNCRWVNWKIQQNNRRNNHIIEYNGEKHTLQEWSEILPINVSSSVLRYRILNGWSIEDAFLKNVRRIKK